MKKIEKKSAPKRIVKRRTKEKQKKVLLIHETHNRELKTATNNKPLYNPWLPREEKVIEPLGYVEPDIDKDPLEDFNLSYAKKIGRLQDCIKSLHLSFEWYGTEEVYEVYKKSLEKTKDAEEKYIYVNENGYYAYGIYDGFEYIDKFTSSNITMFIAHVKTLNLLKREKWKTL